LNSHRLKKCASAVFEKIVRSWLCTQEHWNPELVDSFSAAARYCRVTAGSRHDGAVPDNSALQTGKIYSFPLNISRLFFSCCGSVAAPRQRPGHHDQLPAKKNRAATRESV
jgi:hypothetical protein